MAHGLTGPEYVLYIHGRYRPRKYRDDGNYYYKFHKGEAPVVKFHIDFPPSKRLWLYNYIIYAAIAQDVTGKYRAFFRTFFVI